MVGPKITGLSGDRPTARLVDRQVDQGHYHIRIARDGRWYYRESPITRKPLVTLFASVLQRDPAGQYWLVTPAEKGRIDVDDAPFVGVAMDRLSGTPQRLQFRTNLDDVVIAGPDHPIRVETDPVTGQPSPYLMIRDGLDALICRAVYYQLAELAIEGPKSSAIGLGVWSDDMFFSLEPVDKSETS